MRVCASPLLCSWPTAALYLCWHYAVLDTALAAPPIARRAHDPATVCAHVSAAALRADAWLPLLRKDADPGGFLPA